MRTLKFLLKKEFRQIFRDPSILRIILVMPVIQLLILPWAADYEVKNIQLAVVEHDHSEYSRQLINKITSSGYFILTDYSSSYEHSLEKIEKASRARGQMGIFQGPGGRGQPGGSCPCPVPPVPACLIL